MLNEPLFKVLTKNFGEVTVFHPGENRVTERTRAGELRVVEPGESYNVNCPLCNDTKRRLSISYQWLVVEPAHRRRVTHLANCYNEDCPVRDEEFWKPLIEDLELAELGLLDVPIPKSAMAPRVQAGPIRLPRGCVALDDLAPDHPAITFINNKYKLSVSYISRLYWGKYCASPDSDYPMAKGRIIFPIHNMAGRVIAWQGRTIDPYGRPRWYLPPGFVKCFYNGHRVPPTETPVISEGIMNAIASGPTSIAIFGKSISAALARDFAEKWSSAIIATDADTFVPDNRPGGRGRIFAEELREVLSRYIKDIRMFPWTEDVVELARRHNNGEDVGVPDAAELGPGYMSRQLKELG